MSKMGNAARAASNMATAKKEREFTEGGYSDEDYEEGFDDAEDDGVDEMEKIRKALAREKERATKFHERQSSRIKNDTQSKNSGPTSNPLQL